MQGFLRKLTTWFQSDPRPKRRRTRFHLEQLEDRCLLSNAPLPLLSSDPGAPASLYLDFMGMNEPTWGAYSNVNTPQFHLDGTWPAAASPTSALSPTLRCPTSRTSSWTAPMASPNTSPLRPPTRPQWRCIG